MNLQLAAISTDACQDVIPMVPARQLQVTQAFRVQGRGGKQ